jgi:ribosomal protein L10
MAQFCISFPPPSYKELFEQLKGIKPDFSKLKGLIGLIGLPIPIYLDISQYTNEISQMIQYWQSRLSVKTLLSMIQPMVDLLGLKLADLLPKIPFLNISIVDLMAMDANALRQLVKDTLKQHGQAFLDALSAFLPLPVYFGLNIPSFEINAIIKAVYSFSSAGLIKLVKDLIDQVLGKLKINAVLTLPKLPSLKELQAMIMQTVKAKIEALTGAVTEAFANEFEAFKQAVQDLKMDINAVFEMIRFPPLPAVKFPSPFYPDFSCLALELREAMQMYLQAMMMAVLEKIVSFVKAVLSILNIQFPSICIDIPDNPNGTEYY